MCKFNFFSRFKAIYWKNSKDVLINNQLLSNILTDVFDLFFPEECLNCGNVLEVKGKYLCLFCISEMPLTNFSIEPNNSLEVSFRGRIPIEKATALLYFEKKGMVQKLIHHLKFYNQIHIGSFLGDWLAKKMLLSNRFGHIDLVVPVPLHPKRQRKRGYNQVALFAQTLAWHLNATFVPDLLIKRKNSKTQVSKSRLDRIMDDKHNFVLNKNFQIQGKNILLVDDLITSGATIEACAAPLLDHPGVRISLASMAFTR